MAKDITEIINAATVVRDETGEAANTAARVGGSIAEIAQYIKEEIITPLLTAQSQAVSAERIAEYAKKIAEEAAQKISTAFADKEYYRQNIYLLQEGIGCAAFDYAMSLGDVQIQSEEVTRQEGDSIILDTSANRFVLERSGRFYTRFLSNGASLQGWDVYASRRHTYLNRQDTSYWYRKADGTLKKGSSTFVIRNWLDELQGYCDTQETEITQHGSRITGLETKIQELGAFATYAALFARAAKFDIVRNNDIALLHGTYRQAEGIYHGVLILQQVEMNNAGGGTTMQYIYIEKRQYTRYINFSATAVTDVQSVQNHGARNLSLSGRVLQLRNMWGKDVGSSVTLPDNGNLYEGTAGAHSVPIMLAKTFGGTATATLGAATSARAGVMTVDHVNKIRKLEERVLQYLYPKIYQLNEGAGARKFDGFYTGTASVSAERKTTATEGYTYKVVYKSGNFHLQEISPGGVTISLYSEWDRIGDIASSESYAERDKLFYIYVAGEGSTYYYIDNKGIATEASATYLLRRLIDALGANLATAKSVLEAKDAAAEQRIGALENPPAPDYVEMIIEADTAKHYRLFYDVRCIGWLEIDGAEVELPVITEDRAASYYAALSPGRHVVRFRTKEGNMSDGTPWKERQGLLGWCGENGVTEITLPEGWTVLNIKMFEGAESLRRVNLPSTITEVRFGAFGNCTALEEIVLPASVERIEHIIAHDCPALKRIVLGGRNISAYGTLAQSCSALECVEFRAGGTVAFTSSNNTFVNLPLLGRFIVKGNLPTFECSQPFTSTGYVGSSVEADNRWLFTSDGETPSGTKWQTSLMSQCGFTVKKALCYTLL